MMARQERMLGQQEAARIVCQTGMGALEVEARLNSHPTHRILLAIPTFVLAIQ